MELLFALIPEKYGLLLAAGISFVCAWYVHGRKKKMETDGYKRISDGFAEQSFADRENALKGNMPLKHDWDGMNLRDAEDIRSGMGAILWVRYLDLVFLLLGVFILAVLYQKLSGDEWVDAFMGWFAGAVAVFGCIGAGVVFGLKNTMGSDTKEITGRVRDAYRHPQYSSWRITVSWMDEKKRERIYRCSYAFRKRKCPKVGSEYKLIYSYRYDKVMSVDEIRQNRKNCFYCFGLSVFWIIIVGAKIGLY